MARAAFTLKEMALKVKEAKIEEELEAIVGWKGKGRAAIVEPVLLWRKNWMTIDDKMTIFPEKTVSGPKSQTTVCTVVTHLSLELDPRPGSEKT